MRTLSGRCSLLLLGIFLCPPAARGQQRTPTGFYYPTGRSDLGSYPGFLAMGCNGSTDYFSGEYHLGQDIGASLGDSVYAISNGEVVYKK